MKFFFTIVLLLCCITIANAQKDTLWLDKNWKETNKENAFFIETLYKRKENYIVLMTFI
ncbi:hypothetical protein MK851_07665 [Tenacibaculum sp. 1B UA]|uniref:hypothetical protein n=1 Tax=Tenacibaculum sp. 1B UA TaxID=2922252 RepID=UPI002A247BEA|nr:hypothetical protein [Tenacibaculum sp. 1B UA]MDX8553499.1 hypothetical protein [Tenacibaculum sp. 1B UA]